MHDQVTVQATGAVNGGQAGEDGEYECPVSVLSAIVAAAGRQALAESREQFATRAGVGPELVAGIEDGTRPAWDVPGPQFTAIAGALGPGLGEKLWTATSCDLVLTDVLSGDWAGVAAADALTDPAQIEAARMLLAWAVRGTRDGGAPLLADPERELLRQKAAELAASGTPDAWVGAHLLALFAGQIPHVTPSASRSQVGRASRTRHSSRPPTQPASPGAAS